jgi:hypothetical protein
METLINAPSHWIAEPAIQKQKNDRNIYNKLIVFADSQAKNMTSLFSISLIVQCMLFIPLPALLMFYYHGAVVVLAIVITLFFANIIACIGSHGIRSIVSISALIIIDLIMLVIFLV